VDVSKSKQVTSDGGSSFRSKYLQYKSTPLMGGYL
jgi:hypothetical protein